MKFFDLIVVIFIISLQFTLEVNTQGPPAGGAAPTQPPAGGAAPTKSPAGAAPSASLAPTSSRPSGSPSPSPLSTFSYGSSTKSDKFLTSSIIGGVVGGLIVT